MKELLEKQIVLMTLLVIVIQTTQTSFALLQDFRITIVHEEVGSYPLFLHSSRISRLYLFTVRHKVVLSSSILGS